MSIRVVIAEDQSMVLGALAALLEIEHDINVVGQAHNGKEALQLTLQHKPDLLLTDIEMPEMSGLEVTAELKRQGFPSRVIILPTFARDGTPCRFNSAVTSRPLISGISMSVSNRSGLCCNVSCRASLPLWAWPTTLMSCSISSSAASAPSTML